MAGPRRRFASAGQTVSGAGAGRAGGSRIVDVRHFVAGIRREVAAGWSTGSRGRRAAILLGGTLTAALAGAFLFGAYLSAWSPLFYVLAAVVGFSRVYLGVHYPSDVVIGAIVGASLAGTYLALFRMVVAIWS